MVIPAIIPNSYEDLAVAIGPLRDVARWIQIDVCDGRISPSPSWPYAKGGDPFFARIASQDEGLPFWENFDFEIDLMVARPRDEAPRWIDGGASRVIVHARSLDKPIVEEVKEWRERAEVIAAFGVQDDVSRLTELFGEVDGVQCMGIARIGSQGQPFDKRVFDQIAKVRAAHPDLPISVDGGVDDETLPMLKVAGVTRFVAGSFIFSGGEAAENYRDLVDIAEASDSDAA